MNRIKPKKLLHSKWTATKPMKKDKHFIVSRVDFDEEGVVVLCLIEAVMSRRLIEIDWHDLEDSSKWLHGWI